MFLVFLSFALLASGTTCNKALLYYLPITFLVGLRMFLAGVISLSLKIKNSKNLRLNYIKTHILQIILISFFTTFLPAVLKAYALKNMESSKAALLGSIDPFVTALYAYFLWSEKLTLNKIIGIITAMLGMFILFIKPINISDVTTTIISYPELAAICSVIASRYGWILVQSMLKKGLYSPLEITGITMTLSGFIALCASLVWEDLSKIFMLYDYKLIPLLAHTIIIGNVAGYGLYSYILKKHSSTFVSLTGFSVPIFVFIYGIIFLGEPLSYKFIGSSVITLIGLLIFYKQEILTLKSKAKT